VLWAGARGETDFSSEGGFGSIVSILARPQHVRLAFKSDGSI
jgi:hypothetical protein